MVTESTVKKNSDWGCWAQFHFASKSRTKPAKEKDGSCREHPIITCPCTPCFVTVRVPVFSSYHILTSSMIQYWTDVWQHGIYLLRSKRHLLKSSPSPIQLRFLEMYCITAVGVCIQHTLMLAEAVSDDVNVFLCFSARKFPSIFKLEMCCIPIISELQGQENFQLKKSGKGIRIPNSVVIVVLLEYVSLSYTLLLLCFLKRERNFTNEVSEWWNKSPAVRHASYISVMQWGHGGSGISVREKRYFKTSKMSNEVFQGKTKIKTKTTYLDYIEAKGSMKTSRTFEKSKRMKH